MKFLFYRKLLKTVKTRCIIKIFDHSIFTLEIKVIRFSNSDHEYVYDHEFLTGNAIHYEQDTAQAFDKRENLTQLSKAYCHAYKDYG